MYQQKNGSDGFSFLSFLFTVDSDLLACCAFRFYNFCRKVKKQEMFGAAVPLYPLFTAMIGSRVKFSEPELS